MFVKNNFKRDGRQFMVCTAIKEKNHEPKNMFFFFAENISQHLSTAIIYSKRAII